MTVLLKTWGANMYQRYLSTSGLTNFSCFISFHVYLTNGLTPHNTIENKIIKGSTNRHLNVKMLGWPIKSGWHCKINSNGSHNKTIRCPEWGEKNKATEKGDQMVRQYDSRLIDLPGISSKVILYGRLISIFIKNGFNLRKQIIPIYGSLVKEQVFGIGTNPWYVEFERYRSSLHLCEWISGILVKKKMVKIWRAKRVGDVKHVVEP